ncbi:MAG: DUF4440 domain-containing protein, partial [Arenimonas sp.]
DRVNQAWQQLRTPDRRERYDRAREQVADADLGDWEGAATASLVPAQVQPAMYQPGPAPQVDLRWLPRAIFLGLGATAVAVVAIFSAVRWSEPGAAGQLATGPVAPTALPGLPVSATPRAPLPSDPMALAEVPPALLPPPIELPATPASQPAAKLPPVAPKAALASAAAAPTPAARLNNGGRSSPRAIETPPAPEISASETRRLARAERRAAARQAALAALATQRQVPAEAPNGSMSSTSLAPIALAEGNSAPSPPKIGAIEANRLLNHFSRAYEAGDLDGMRAMFAPDIRGSHGNRDQILADYDRLFGSSTERSLQVRDVSWFASGDVLTIVASFEASVTGARGGRPRRSRGDLRLDLRRDDAQWRIIRLQHGG